MTIVPIKFAPKIKSDPDAVIPTTIHKFFVTPSMDSSLRFGIIRCNSKERLAKGIRLRNKTIAFDRDGGSLFWEIEKKTLSNTY